MGIIFQLFDFGLLLSSVQYTFDEDGVGHIYSSCIAIVLGRSCIHVELIDAFQMLLAFYHSSHADV